MRIRCISTLGTVRHCLQGGKILSGVFDFSDSWTQLQALLGFCQGLSVLALGQVRILKCWLEAVSPCAHLLPIHSWLLGCLYLCRFRNPGKLDSLGGGVIVIAASQGTTSISGGLI